jgi:hypothetical protein
VRLRGRKESLFEKNSNVDLYNIWCIMYVPYWLQIDSPAEKRVVPFSWSLFCLGDATTGHSNVPFPRCRMPNSSDIKDLITLRRKDYSSREA